jgi:hypothetical protein
VTPPNNNNKEAVMLTKDDPHHALHKDNQLEALDRFFAAYKKATDPVDDMKHFAAHGKFPPDRPIDPWILRDIYWILDNYRKELLKNA